MSIKKAIEIVKILLEFDDCSDEWQCAEDNGDADEDFDAFLDLDTAATLGQVNHGSTESGNKKWIKWDMGSLHFLVENRCRESDKTSFQVLRLF